MCGKQCQAEGQQVWTGGQAGKLRTSGQLLGGQQGPAGREGKQMGRGPGSRQPITAAAPRAVPASQCPTPDPSLRGQVSSRPGARLLQGPQRNRQALGGTGGPTGARGKG